MVWMQGTGDGQEAYIHQGVADLLCATILFPPSKPPEASDDPLHLGFAAQAVLLPYVHLKLPHMAPVWRSAYLSRCQE